MNQRPQRRVLAPIALALGGAFGIAAAVLADGSAGRIDFALAGPVLVAGLFAIAMSMRDLARHDPTTSEHEVFGSSASRLLVLVPMAGLLVQPLLLTPYDPSLTALILHAGVALVAGFVLVGPKSSPKAIPRALELTLGATLLLFVGGEISLRILAAQRPGPVFVQKDETGESRLQKLRRPGLVRFGTPTNDDGAFDGAFELEADSDERTVLVLGDEAMLGAVPACVTPTVLAEGVLGDTAIWDHSLRGTSLLEHQALLAEWETDGRLDGIDQVIVAISSVDDWFQSRRRQDAFRPLALWLDRQNALLPSFARRATSPELRELILEGELSTEIGPPTVDQIADRFPAVVDPSAATSVISPEQFQLRTRAEARKTRTALDTAALEEALRILNRMQTTCEEHGARFGVFVLPHRAELDDAFATAADVDPRIWSDARLELVERLRKRGTPVSDTAAILQLEAQRLPAKGADLFHPIDFRFNRTGTSSLGEILASFIREVAAS